MKDLELHRSASPSRSLGTPRVVTPENMPSAIVTPDKICQLDQRLVIRSLVIM